MRKGTWITAILWIVAVAAHYGYDDLVAGHITGKNGSSVGNATVLLYLVISLTVQQFVLLARVKRQDAAGEVPPRARRSRSAVNMLDRMARTRLVRLARLLRRPRQRAVAAAVVGAGPDQGRAGRRSAPARSGRSACAPGKALT